MLTAAQRLHFETFGFLVMREYFSAEEIETVTRAFDRVLDEDRQGLPFKGGSRQAVLGCIEKDPVLTGLVEDNRVYCPIRELLGPDFVWIGSDGNLYVGDTGWHPDGSDPGYRRIKVAFYLDPVSRNTGCLRVIPGSHAAPMHDKLRPLSRQREDPETSPFDVGPDEVPGFPLESSPGDVVFFNQDLWHASFGGKTGRRMFTLNFGRKPTEDAHIAYLKRVYRRNLKFVETMQFTQSGRVYEDAFLGSERPRIRGMVAKLVEMGFR